MNISKRKLTFVSTIASFGINFHLGYISRISPSFKLSLSELLSEVPKVDPKLGNHERKTDVSVATKVVSGDANLFITGCP